MKDAQALNHAAIIRSCWAVPENISVSNHQFLHIWSKFYSNELVRL